MERRAKTYGIDPLEQKKIWDLTDVPDEILMHFDP
jgi:hypothetical protein